MSNTDNNLTTVNLREFVFEYLIANCYASTANAFLEDEKRTKARREAYLHPPDVSSTPTAEDKLQELKLEADQRAATLARARKAIHDALLCGQISSATDILFEHFPQLQRVKSSSHSFISIPSRYPPYSHDHLLQKEGNPFRDASRHNRPRPYAMFPRDFGDSEWGHFNPTTVEIKLQIQEFVEVARTVSLPTRGPGPGTRPRNALENSREVIEPHQRRRVMTYSDQAGEKKRPRSPKGKVTKQRRNELDERMKDLISLITRCEDRTVRLRYLEQLTNFSGVLVRYDSPEATMAYGMNLKGANTNLYDQKMHCMSCISRSCLPPPWQADDIPECIHSRVYYWLSYQRRIDLANEINQVTLCCTLCSPYPFILRLTQHISTLFHFLSEWEVTLPQRKTWVSQRVDPLRLLDYYDGERRTLQADLAKLNSWRQLFLPNLPLRAQARPLLNRCVDYIMDNLDLNSLFNSTEEKNESIPVVELDNDLRRMVIDLLLYEKEAERLGGEDAAIFQRKPWDEEFLDELYPGPYLGVKAVPFVLHTWLYCQTTKGR